MKEMKYGNRFYLLPLLLNVFFIGGLYTVAAQTPAALTLSREFLPPDTLLHEKIYAHTDKSFYLTGELLWFQLYDVESTSHLPLNISKVAYVELLDNNGRPVQQAKIDLQHSGAGSLYLPVTLHAGNYRLRAYTAWMKNFGSESFFQKTIQVFNPLMNEALSQAPPEAGIRADFFPEGGNLVAGLPAKVGFKIADAYGKGIAAQGLLIDENGDTITRFQPLVFGLGSFVFTPQPAHHYRAIIQVPGKKDWISELPEVIPTGYTLHVSPAPNQQVKISIYHSQRGVAAGPVMLIAHHNQRVAAAEQVILKDGATDIYFAKSSLPEGVTQFTLFDYNKQPVAERMYFKSPATPFNLTAQSDAATYTQRKPVTLQIANTTKAASLPTHLSLSVYRVDSVQQPDAMNIVSYLWLTSELKGTIESPEYYLSQPEAKEEAIDNLMLTHGWRKFKQNETADHTPALIKYAPDYYGQLITGRVTDTRTGQPVKDVQTYLSVPGKVPQFYTDKSDEQGMVRFTVTDYYGPGEVVLQVNNQTDSFSRVELFSPFAERDTATSSLSPFYLSKDQQATLLTYSVAMQVRNIYARDSMERFAVPAIDSLPFYGHANYTYSLDDYTRFTTMEEVLREYVREINVRKRDGQLQLVLLNEPQKDLFITNSLILLDGVPVFDQSKLFSYDPLKVQKLEVIPRRFYAGYTTFDGIASFKTYSGNMEGYQLDPKAVVLDYEGLQLQREFYSPVYDSPSQAASRLPDFRNVLYWSPHVVTDANGAATVRFYTSDQKGTFHGVVQGLNSAGQATYTTFDFTVN